MKQFAIGLVLALLAVGCHGQVPPASPGYQVNLSWTPAAASGNWAGCTTSSPCVYALYAEILAADVSACDPTTSGNYKEITTPTTRPSGSSYVDPNTTGLTKCYDVETVQAGQNSGPSNIAGPAVSPGIPLAPALATPAPTVAMLEKPTLPTANPILYAPDQCRGCFVAVLSAPVGLTAKMVKH